MNAAYEFLFDQDAWRAGHPVFRWLGAVAMTLPFIVVGLATIGLATTRILSALRAENFVLYSVAGCIGGAVFLPLLTVPRTWFDGVPSGVLPEYGLPATMLAVTSLYGLICAVLWWLIVRRGNQT